MYLLVDFNSAITIQEPIQSSIVKKKFNGNSISNKYNPSTMKANKLGRAVGGAALIGGGIAAAGYLVNKLNKKENNG